MKEVVIILARIVSSAFDQVRLRSWLPTWHLAKGWMDGRQLGPHGQPFFELTVCG